MGFELILSLLIAYYFVRNTVQDLTWAARNKGEGGDPPSFRRQQERIARRERLLTGWQERRRPSIDERRGAHRYISNAWNDACETADELRQRRRAKRAEKRHAKWEAKDQAGGDRNNGPGQNGPAQDPAGNEPDATRPGEAGGPGQPDGKQEAGPPKPDAGGHPDPRRACAQCGHLFQVDQLDFYDDARGNTVAMCRPCHQAQLDGAPAAKRAPAAPAPPVASSADLRTCFHCRQQFPPDQVSVRVVTGYPESRNDFKLTSCHSCRPVDSADTPPTPEQAPVETDPVNPAKDGDQPQSAPAQRPEGADLPAAAPPPADPAEPGPDGVVLPFMRQPPAEDTQTSPETSSATKEEEMSQMTETGETTNLSKALTYTSGMANSCGQGVSNVETSLQGLTEGQVGGQTLSHLEQAREALEQAQASFAAANTALQEHLAVKEAYEATQNQAGSKDFVTQD